MKSKKEFSLHHTVRTRYTTVYSTLAPVMALGGETLLRRENGIVFLRPPQATAFLEGRGARGNRFQSSSSSSSTSTPPAAGIIRPRSPFYRSLRPRHSSLISGKRFPLHENSRRRRRKKTRTRTKDLEVWPGRVETVTRSSNPWAD